MSSCTCTVLVPSEVGGSEKTGVAGGTGGGKESKRKRE